MSIALVENRERRMIENKKGTVVNFQELKVLQWDDNKNEVMLMKTKCCALGFNKSKKRR